MIDKKTPRHIGIIMDGNGRWATARGKERSYGHKHGSNNVDRIVQHAFSKGVFALTLYAFSSENWARPQKEVDELMKLLKTYLRKFASKLAKNQIRLIVAGSRQGLSPELVKEIDKVERDTCHYTEHILNIALNYGGRQEIVNAVNKLIAEGKPITVDNISQNLYTVLSGEPDLIIRTGGEKRTSNFLMFQGAYSELYFCDVLWPDFDEAELDKAILAFGERKRRYGKI